MNLESLEILKNARADKQAGKIQQWQYEAIVKQVMRAEVENVIIYHDGEIDLLPAAALYVAFEAE